MGKGVVGFAPAAGSSPLLHEPGSIRTAVSVKPSNDAKDQPNDPGRDVSNLETLFLSVISGRHFTALSPFCEASWQIINNLRSNPEPALLHPQLQNG